MIKFFPLRLLIKQLKAKGLLPCPPLERRLLQRDVVLRASRKFNIQLYHHNSRWPDDQAFVQLMRGFQEDYDKIGDRHYSLYQLALTVSSLPGDTAECGVLAGKGSYIICAAMQREGYRHHLFDSFEGLSEIRPEDRHGRPDVFQFQAGDLSVGEQRVLDNLSAFAEMLNFHKGWIPERFPDVADRRFALVHIDVDLYQPTRDSLEFFFPRLVPGGMIICDDYGLYSCPGAHQAMNEFAAKIGIHVAHLTCGQGLIIKTPLAERAVDLAAAQASESPESLSRP